MIKLTHANKYYNKGRQNQIHVINDVSLELPESGMVAIFGKSGCGKTTLLNAIGGLDSIDGGTITVFGNDMRRDPDTVRNKYIGYIFQNYNLSKEQTVFENVANALRLCGVEDENVISERVNAALRNVGMEKFGKRMPDALSGGQQQRVAIARAIVKNPAIILADEPTGNLDEANTVMIMDMLRSISKEHLVLLVTHEANLVDYYCDRVIEIVDGSISSERLNENADGYSRRDKNIIYLGELERREATIPGAEIEYYGEPSGEVKLRIVSVNGKLYLQSNTPNLRILDASSEIKLSEGVFEENAANEVSKNIDMSALPPVQGDRFGRLFGFKDSVKEAYRVNFTQKVKKGNKFLRALLILLAVIIVFSSARFAVFIRDLGEINEKCDDNTYYVELTENNAGSFVDIMGQHGIDYMRIIGSYEMSDFDTFTFSPGNFISANVKISATAKLAPFSSMPKGAKAIAGTLEVSGKNDAIISKATADKMLRESPASYIDEYSDLIGLVSSSSVWDRSSESYRIVGIADSDVLAMYVDDRLVVKDTIITYYYNRMLSATDVSSIFGVNPDSGEVVIYAPDGMNYSSNTIMIAGREYNVASVIRNYQYLTDYLNYLSEVKGKIIPSPEEYAADQSSETTEFEAYMKWFYECYIPDLPGYLDACERTQPLGYEQWVCKAGTDPWIAAFSAPYENTYAKQLLSAVNNDQNYIAAAYFYKLMNGSYPKSIGDIDGAEADGTPLMDYVEKVGKGNLDTDESYARYNDYVNEYWDHTTYYGFTAIMNDEDYKTLAYSAGKTDDNLYNYISDYFQGSGWFRFNKLYILVHTSDPDDTGKFLSSIYSSGEEIITPKNFEKNIMKESLGSIIANAVSLAVMVGIMCLCIYFIMRSSFMSRVKEIGIYRAIGVSKRNLRFKYLIEALLVTTLTVFIGYMIAFLFVSLMISTLNITSMLYFPAWLGAVILIVIYGFCTLFGLLPVSVLLRKTPAGILAKYDI